MSRFPPEELSGDRVQLFLNESAILLFKTELATPFLWTLFAFVVVQLFITPFITAGLYNSLHTEGPRGTVFIQGICKLGGSFTLLFWIPGVVYALIIILGDKSDSKRVSTP